MPVTITLNQIKAHSPCVSGWRNVLRGQGKTESDDAPFPLSSILDSNDLADTIWALRCDESFKPISVAFAQYCAEQARKYAARAARADAYAAAAADAYAAAYVAADAAAYAAAADAAADAAAYAAADAADAADAAYAAYAAADAADAADAAYAVRDEQSHFLRQLLDA